MKGLWWGGIIWVMVYLALVGMMLPQWMTGPVLVGLIVVPLIMAKMN